MRSYFLMVFFCCCCLKVSEGEKCEVTVDAYFLLTENCTDNTDYVNKSEDIDNPCLFQCEKNGGKVAFLIFLFNSYWSDLKKVRNVNF